MPYNTPYWAAQYLTTPVLHSSPGMDGKCSAGFCSVELSPAQLAYQAVHRSLSFTPTAYSSLSLYTPVCRNVHTV